MYYHLVTLGCQMNKSDSERVSCVIKQLGYQWTDNEAKADLLGVIACSVRQKAIDKVYTRIHKWNKWKNNKNLVTFVSGCVLPDDRDKFLNLFDLIFQMSELPHLGDMLAQYGVVSPISLNSAVADSLVKEEEHSILKIARPNGKITITGQPVLMKKPDEHINEFWDIKPKYNSDFEAFVPIQNGCDKFCTYCAVPYTRGREISRPSDEIVEEVKRLVESGYKSITLLGQNVNSYGKDKNGQEVNFAQLLEKIGSYGDSCGMDFWLYYTSPHPKDMTDDVLEAMSKYKCIAKWVHLPIQSGDNHMLIRMNRNHSVAEYRKIVASIRRILPEANLFTDIIVGFTGETEEEFQHTADAMEEFRYNMAYIARYSPRPGAVSARWEDNVPHAVKKERLHILSELLKKHSNESNQEMIGKDYRVLIHGKDRKEGHLTGTTEGKIIVRVASENTDLIGKFVDVRINSAAEFAAQGELVEIFA